MKKLLIFCLLLTSLFMGGCTSAGGLFCDPRVTHCGGSDPQMQDEIADEVGQVL